MRFTRKLLIGAGAIFLPLGLTTLLEGTAGATPPNIGAANGTINCTAVTAKVKFTPPIESTGDTNFATASITGSLKTCKTTGNTNLPAGSHITGSVTAKITTTTSDNSANSCGGLVTTGSSPKTLKVKWVDKNSSGVVIATLNPTTVTFSGYDAVFNPPTDGSSSFPGFDLPQDSGGSSSLAAGSSFPGSDGGTSSEANAFSNLTVAQISSACGNASTDGLASLTLAHAGSTVDPRHAHFG